MILLYDTQEMSFLTTMVWYGSLVLVIVPFLGTLLYFMWKVIDRIDRYSKNLSEVKDELTKSIHNSNIAIERLSGTIEKNTLQHGDLKAYIVEYITRHSGEHSTDKATLHLKIKEVLDATKQIGKTIQKHDNELQEIMHYLRAHDKSIYDLLLMHNAVYHRVVPDLLVLKGGQTNPEEEEEE